MALRYSTYVLQFGLLSIPMGIAPVEPSVKRTTRTVAPDGTPIKQIRIHPDTGEEVPYSEQRTAWFFDDGSQVIVTKEERAACAATKDGAVTIRGRVQLSSIPWRVLDKPHLVLPGKVNKKVTAPDALATLHGALMAHDSALVVTYVRRSAEVLAVLYPVPGALLVQDLRFGEGLRDPHALPEPDAGAVALAAKLLEDVPRMGAGNLLATTDEHAARIEAMVEEKRAGLEVPTSKGEAVKPNEAEDIMAILKRSVAAGGR